MNFFQAELYHYGIKGQKYGVRRFQNEDGSLTEEGKRRYRSSAKIGEQTASSPNKTSSSGGAKNEGIHVSVSKQRSGSKSKKSNKSDKDVGAIREPIRTTLKKDEEKKQKTYKWRHTSAYVGGTAVSDIDTSADSYSSAKTYVSSSYSKKKVKKLDKHEKAYAQGKEKVQYLLK